MSEPLNQTLVSELRLLMEDDFPLLLETFLAESERQFQRISVAWHANDLDDLRRSAHALKGSCSNIGAEALAAQCAALEIEARRGSRPEAAVIERLEYTVDEVQGAVRKL